MSSEVVTRHDLFYCPCCETRLRANADDGQRTCECPVCAQRLINPAPVSLDGNEQRPQVVPVGRLGLALVVVAYAFGLFAVINTGVVLGTLSGVCWLVGFVLSFVGMIRNSGLLESIIGLTLACSVVVFPGS